MTKVLIIQNDQNEGPGQLGVFLERRAIEMHTLFAWELKLSEIDLAEWAALIVLGGQQGVYEQERYPYLTSEIVLCQKFIDEQKPIFGVCLGAQILASALGGEVKQNTHKELGWHKLMLSDGARHDSLFREHPQEILAYHFHGDYFDTPPECINLASSALTPCQAFRYGKHAYGLQYHCEVDQALVESMCRANVDYMAENASDAEAVIAESKILLPDYQSQCASMLDAWIDTFAA